VVLVPLDGSAHALAAVPVARTLARLEGAIIQFVHVGRTILPAREALTAVGLTSDELRGGVLDSRHGEPEEGILAAARERDSRVVVMCTHTGVPKPGKTLGAAALGVLSDAPCPVVFVRPDRGLGPWSLERLLVADDGTPSTSAAMSPAVALARRAGAHLWVVHVAQPRAQRPEERGTMRAPRYVDQPQHEWPSWSHEFLQRLARSCTPDELHVQFRLARGDPAAEVLRLASEQRADLIAVAWRGRWAQQHAAVLKAIIRSSPCPVQVLRG
jgi:nucleotide-binding universal stress UspA family protein